MNQHRTASAPPEIDRKIADDWERIEARRAEVARRDGGDARRRAILRALSAALTAGS